MQSPRCSVIVVSFDSGPALLACVRSVLSSTVAVQLLVSDNGSGDGSIATLREELGADPRIEILENGVNLGFAAACNRALARARAPWLLFLNPDCVLEPDTLARMLAVVEGIKDLGMAGCLVRNDDGSEQAGCRRREPTPGRSLVRVLRLGGLSDRFPFLTDFDMHREPLPAGPLDVDAISGAFMLVRRDALETVGPLDEGYFLHCEDLDWCRRFRDAGFRVLFVPGVEVLHHKGLSSRARPVRVEWHKHRGMARYYRKYFSRRYPRGLLWLVLAMIWGRFTLVSLYVTVRRVLA